MDRTTTTIIRRAFLQARQRGDGSVTPGHILLALTDEPSTASTLADLGITHDNLPDLLADRARTRQEELGLPRPHPEGKRTLTLGPSAHRIMGWAEGCAVGQNDNQTAPEHWLLALVYLEAEWFGALLHALGTSSDAVLAGLRQRGLRVPDVATPAYRPWRGMHHLDIAEADRDALLELLGRRHPPQSEWRWGFNGAPDDPRHWRIYAEEGINLRELLTEAQRPSAS